MLLITKGYTRLQVETDESVKVWPLEPEFGSPSIARVIAQSLRVLLQYQIRYGTITNEEWRIVSYLQQNGWKVERLEGC